MYQPVLVERTSQPLILVTNELAWFALWRTRPATRAANPSKLADVKTAFS